jgi:peptide deformylase
MALLPIRIFGDPVLRQRAAEVTEFDERLARLADDMLATMRAASGLGLAANQVGVLKRLFTWEVFDEAGGSDSGTWVNPEILETSEELQEGDEGCLSFPSLYYPTPRPLEARIKAFDVHGEPHEVTGVGTLARILLHEIDHLNGILFIDHLARHDKKEAMRRIRAGELEQSAQEREIEMREAQLRAAEISEAELRGSTGGAA